MDKLKFTQYLAKKAGEFILASSKKPFNVRSKSGIEIVTETDIEVENLLSGLIRNSKYNYPILSEENLKAEITSEKLWIIDPLDGTTNFSKGNPRLSCSIALAYRGKVILGAVYNPCIRELFYSQGGKGAYLNKKPIHVSKVRNLNEAVVCVDSRYDTAEERKRGIKLYSLLAPSISRGIRQTGSASLDICDVAAGRFDAYICAGYPKITPWDFAAGGLILEEAGGRLTDFKGKKWDLNLADWLATNRGLSTALIKIIEPVAI